MRAGFTESNWKNGPVAPNSDGRRVFSTRQRWEPSSRSTSPTVSPLPRKIPLAPSCRFAEKFSVFSGRGSNVENGITEGAGTTGDRLYEKRQKGVK